MKIRKMILTFAVLSLLLSPFLGYAQAQKYKIGDKLPDFELKEILFSNGKSAKLSDFIGKILILDYWTIGCIPCIKAMPKYDKLQKQFGDKIAIIPIVDIKRDKAVTLTEFETAKQRHETFWKKNKYTSHTALPTVLDTSGLRARFSDSNGVPFEIWINGEGVLVGMTDGEAVNEQEIQSVLSGNKVSSSMWPDRQFDLKQSLLSVDWELKCPNMWYTMITPYRDVIKFGNDYRFDSVMNTTRLSVINRTIEGFFSSVGVLPFKDGGYFSQKRNHILLEVKDPVRYKFQGDGYFINWWKNNNYCYESVLPGKIDEALMISKMKKDVQDFFGITAGFEQRTMDCWTLVRVDNDNELLVSKRKEDPGKRMGTMFPESSMYAENVKTVTTTITSVKDLINWMNRAEDSNRNPINDLPIVDETGILNPIRLILDIDIGKESREVDQKSISVTNIKRQLKQYGLDLIPAKREIEVFVITEKGYTNEKSSK